MFDGPDKGQVAAATHGSRGEAGMPASATMAGQIGYLGDIKKKYEMLITT